MSLQLVEAYTDTGDEETEQDVRWFEYCRMASTLRREEILAVLLSDLGAEDSPMYALIDSALDCPPEPGRARESLMVLARLG